MVPGAFYKVGSRVKLAGEKRSSLFGLFVGDEGKKIDGVAGRRDTALSRNR
jgi:hypothetical protein